MDKRYLHQDHEQKVYQLWEKSNAFDPDVVIKNPAQDKSRKTNQNSFCILLPPPNANDPLHVGHAMYVVEDCLIRYHRMLGDDTLWLPGTDHAGIETQFVFEKKLQKEGKSRFNFDRATLYQMIWDYVQNNSNVAVEQLKKLGFSLDWSRFKFMLDPDIVDEVLKTFEKLYNEDLVYRDLKLVNYCTRCGTSYSELEVKHQDKQDLLYTIQYGPLTVSTVRPETLFGDVALAVNPQDKRYSKYVGKTIRAEFPWGVVELPIIADDYVDREFGTGVLKITPYHDANDWDVWQRHAKSLPKPKQVIDLNGKLINVPEKYLGLGVVNARKQIVEDLENNQQMVEVEKYSHSVGTCYRCSRNIEPLPLPQFFIKVEPLTKPILESLKNKEVKIHGAGYTKTLKHWLENLKDWNISRQIVWGIPIPVWYEVENNTNKINVSFIDKKGEFHQGPLNQWLETFSLEEIKSGLQQLRASKNTPFVVSKNQPQDGKQYLPETDTFDTWFSSAQWPFTTLKTTKPGDFERFYPTQVMETGYDILPFWVMRMLMIGKFATQKLPFSQVYLHGLIRDKKGQKMSKSKGNVVNPLEVSEKFGTDSLRMSLVIRSTPGLDKSVGDGDFKAARNLTNKVWNAARFVILSQEEQNEGRVSENKMFREKLNQIISQVTSNFERLQVGLAADTVHNEFWHWYCDECIEKSKSGDLSNQVILEGLITFLKLFHPFIPFVTEAIWQELVEAKLVDEKLLVLSKWPS